LQSARLLAAAARTTKCNSPETNNQPPLTPVKLWTMNKQSRDGNSVDKCHGGSVYRKNENEKNAIQSVVCKKEKGILTLHIESDEFLSFSLPSQLC